MLGAAGYKTSEFDKNLENDFEGADETLPVNYILSSNQKLIV
jgi:hypothetical protein